MKIEQLIYINKNVLNEVEVYETIKDFGINLPKYFYQPFSSSDKEEFIRKALEIPSDKVVIKMVSSTNLHKTDSGGVRIVPKKEQSISKAYDDIASIGCEGIVAIEFLPHGSSIGEEILIGVRYDEAFGYVMVVGPGGTFTERLTRSIRKEYLPQFIAISDVGANSIRKFIDESWIFAFTLGRVRGVSKKCEFEEIEKTLLNFIAIIKEFEKNSIYVEEIEVNPFIVSCGKLIAADGVIRLRKNAPSKRIIPSDVAIKSITEPQSIAICGVSDKKQNMARIILNNTLKAGFPSQRMYIIKKGVYEIDGVKTYPSVKEVPQNIDMYIVSVPVDGLVDVLKEAADSRKVNGVVLITGGVGEKSGTESIQNDIIRIIKDARNKNPNFALNGGNCMGIVLNRSKINTFFIPEYKMKSPTGKNPYMVSSAFVSQSGAFVISTLTKMPHLMCDYIITVGNQHDLTVVDYIDYFSKMDVKLILSYIEGFKPGDGERLLKIASRMKNDKKILVIYKAGRTAIGQRAVVGHTASLAGDYIVFEKLVSQAGAIVCDSFDEFCDMAWLSSYASAYKITSNKAFFISNAGFETTGMADNISFLEAYEGDEKLKNRINDILKKYRLDSIVDFKNPMDITPMANDDALAEIVDAIYSSSLYSVIFISPVPLTPAMNTVECESSPDRFEGSFINKISPFLSEKKVFMPLCVASGSLYDAYCEYAASKGFVVFRSADRMVKAFEKYLRNIM